MHGMVPLKQIVLNSPLFCPSASPPSGFHQKENKIEMNTHNPCTHSGKLEALLSLYHSCPSCSGTRSTCLPHERATTILRVFHRRLGGVHHNRVLIYKLTGRIGERRQGQCDALHFTLINFLFVLFLQVFPPGLKKNKRYMCMGECHCVEEGLSKGDTAANKGLCSLRNRCFSYIERARNTPCCT